MQVELRMIANASYRVYKHEIYDAMKNMIGSFIPGGMNNV